MTATKMKIGEGMDEVHARRLMIAIFYTSRWDRLSRRLWRLDPFANAMVEPVREGSIRDRLAIWADSRDHAWRNRYAKKGRYPSDKWKRKQHSSDEENVVEEFSG